MLPPLLLTKNTKQRKKPRTNLVHRTLKKLRNCRYRHLWMCVCLGGQVRYVYLVVSLIKKQAHHCSNCPFSTLAIKKKKKDLFSTMDTIEGLWTDGVSRYSGGVRDHTENKVMWVLVWWIQSQRSSLTQLPESWQPDILGGGHWRLVVSFLGNLNNSRRQRYWYQRFSN